MTRDNDIERVLEHWFSEGPTQMPSRFLDDTLDRIDRAPQRRLARLRTRSFAMHPDRRLVAAAAVIVLIAGVGLTVLGGAPAVGVSPSPSPTVVPSPTVAPSSSEVLSGLVGPSAQASRWLSVGTRRGSLSGTPGKRELFLGPAGIRIPEYPADVLSTASMADANHLALRLDAGAGGGKGAWICQIGDAGRYAVSLSQGGVRLTLTPLDDACAERSGVLAGDWLRWDCPNPNGYCLGDLQPGPNVAYSFQAYLAAPDQLAYTVPDGWMNPQDNPATYVLASVAGNGGIWLVSNVVPRSQDPDCPDAVAPGVGRSATALADWLTTLPGLVTTTPTPVTVGSLSGVTLDLSVAPGWTRTCADSLGKPTVQTFTSTDESSDPVPRSLKGDGRARYILLDLSDGSTLLISIESADQPEWETLMREAMPVVGTFTFVH